MLYFIAASALMLLGAIRIFRSRSRANSRRSAADLPEFQDLIWTFSGYVCAVAAFVFALLAGITALHR